MDNDNIMHNHTMRVNKAIMYIMWTALLTNGALLLMGMLSEFLIIGVTTIGVVIST